MIYPTDERRYFLFSFPKKQMAYLIDPFLYSYWNGMERKRNGWNETKRKTVPSQFFVVMLGGKMFSFFFFVLKNRIG